MSRRLQGAHLAGSWEFPGGKVELGEDPAQALSRELREELNIEVEVGQIYAVGHHCYPDKDIVLLIYECRHSGRTPEALEVAEFAWLSPAQVCALELPPADEEVITRLRQELDLLNTSQAPRADNDMSARRAHDIALQLELIEERALKVSLHGLEQTQALGARLGALLRASYQARSRPPQDCTQESSRDRSSKGLTDLSEPLGQLPLVIAAHGDLGAGKTSLAQGLARGLRVPEGAYVNSPTFSLLQSHPVDGDQGLFFHHLDLYRLEDEDELDALGFDEVLSDGVGFVEWPTRGAKLFRGPHWRATLSYPQEGATSRLLTLELCGMPEGDSAQLLAYTHAQLTKQLDRGA